MRNLWIWILLAPHFLCAQTIPSSVIDAYDEGARLSYEGRYREAIPFYRQAAEEYGQKVSKKDTIYTLLINDLALLYKEECRYDLAEDLLLKVCDLYKELLGENHGYYAIALNNLAGYYKDRNLYASAESLYKEVIELRKKNLGEEHPSITIPLNNMALLYALNGNYPKADELYKEVLERMKKNKEEVSNHYAATCSNYANLCIDMGRYEFASKLLYESLDIYQKTIGKQHPDYAMTLNTIGLLLEKQGDISGALPFFEQSLAIIEDVLGQKHPYYAEILNNIAAICDQKGDFKKAETLYQQSLKLRKELYGEINPGYINSLSNIAVLYHSFQKPEQASLYYKELNIANKRFIREVLPHFTESEKKLYISHQFPYFDNYLTFAIQYRKERPELSGDLLNFRLFTKGLVMYTVQKSQQALLESGDQALIGKYNEWKALGAKLAQVYGMDIAERESKGIFEKQLQELREQTEKLEKELSLASQSLHPSVNSPDYTWKDIQKVLMPGEAAVEMIRMEYTDHSAKERDTLYAALLITPSSASPEIVLLENGYDLENKYAKNYINSIRNKLTDKLSYGKYWKPMMDKLQGIKRVYFSSDGVYNSINLETFYNPEKEVFLGDETEIHLMGNLSELLSKEFQGTPRKAVLIGYPDYNGKPATSDSLSDRGLVDLSSEDQESLSAQRFFDGKDISMLPGTLKEVEDIAQLFGQSSSVTLYLRSQATEQNLKSVRNPDVLHIATHGFFLKDLPSQAMDKTRELRLELGTDPLFRSGLLLSNAKTAFLTGEDGVLTAREAASLYLDDTRLVVLSACETALGEIQNGEGVYGLQRAFRIAGAANLIVSLWKVNDLSTQQMMVYFYENLLNKKQSIREAFYNARKSLRTIYPEPYYWGAFVLLGE